MKKLINLNVNEAKNVICVWRVDCDEHSDYYVGIGLDTAKLGYTIPRYIAIGTFDDGTIMAGGLHSLNDINQPDYFDEEYGLFLYHQFMHSVGIYEAKALVRGEIADGEYDDEQSAKKGIYANLLRVGIEMTEDAEEYFKSSN